jgi:hypothetical protein
MPSGDWCQFSCESKARSFIVDLDNSDILRSPNDLAQLGFDDLKHEYRKLVKIPYGGVQHNTTIAIELWGLLLSHAKNPLAAFDGKSRGDGKVLGKRESLVYKVLLTVDSDATLKAAYTKLPRQAKVCLDLIQRLEAVHPFVDNKLLYRELNKVCDELKTKQNPIRVMKYYQSLMISEGLLRIARR